MVSKKNNENNLHSPKVFKKGCLLWILLSLFFICLIILYIYISITKIHPLTPKEVFFQPYFDGFLQINLDSNQFFEQSVEITKEAASKMFKPEDNIDAKQLNYFLTYLFHPKVYIFTKRDIINNESEESYLVILAIKRLPNFLKKICFQILENHKFSLEDIKKDKVKRYRVKTDNEDEIFIASTGNSFLISNRENIINNAIQNKLSNKSNPQNISNDFMVGLNRVNQNALVSGFFINLSGRLQEYFFNEYVKRDTIAEIIKEYMDTMSKQSDLINEINYLTLETDVINRHNLSFLITASTKTPENAALLSTALNTIVFPEIQKSASDSFKLETLSEAKGNECVVKINFSNFEESLKKALE